MNKLTLLFRLFRNMGLRYVLFRMQYEWRRRMGLLKKAYPSEWRGVVYPTLAEWKQAHLPFFWTDRKELQVPGKDPAMLSESVKLMEGGTFRFFSSTRFPLGVDYDWVTNPETHYKYDIHAHWTEIEDLDAKAGDIKYVWEKSRFTFLYDLIRYDQKTMEDHSDFVFGQIMDWIRNNPLNYGPNYKCSQEISLRVLNWIFALYYYKDSAYLTDEVFDKIIRSIYGQMKHVRSNINFSRIAVRNNHAITETLGLYIVGLLFPWFPEAREWRVKGKRWFEAEIKYQIAQDGTYLQCSMNYHRVVVQLLTWAIALADKCGEAFCDEVYERAYQSVNFLYQCQDEASGFLPNYGANDGALFFKLNDCHYRDYRPQLDVLHYLLTGKDLYDSVYEDRSWFAPNRPMNRKMYPPMVKQCGCIRFDRGGYYLIRESDYLTFIRCGRYKFRPGHADNLHVDIWYKGENILLDGGSYKYNTTEELTAYFVGTASHNTVMLDEYNQMLKGPRFIWYHWSQAKAAKIYEMEDRYVFEGEVACFAYLDKRLRHRRKVIKWKNSAKWDVEDTIVGKREMWRMRQIWHTQSAALVFESDATGVPSRQAFYSSFYGTMEPCRQLEFHTNRNEIKTTVQVI